MEQCSREQKSEMVGRVASGKRQEHVEGHVEKNLIIIKTYLQRRVEDTYWIKEKNLRKFLVQFVLF